MLNRGESRGTIKLSPKIRNTPIAEAIPTIPLDKINSFLLANRIVDDEKTFTSAPYIVAGNAERIVSGTGDRIYARGKFADGQPAYGIFRQGKVYIDPKTKEVLGINADDIGGGEVVATEGDVATLALTRTTQEVRLGDRLFPTEERAVNSTFMPGEPSREVKGEIIDVPRGVTQIGQFDVVTLNRGQRDGLAEGNVLAIYKVGETVRDRVTGESVKIPDERAGLLMVFRTYKKLSYALVLMASRPLSVTDRVQNPDSKPRLGGVSRSGKEISYDGFQDGSRTLPSSCQRWTCLLWMSRDEEPFSSRTGSTAAPAWPARTGTHALPALDRGLRFGLFRACRASRRLAHPGSACRGRRRLSPRCGKRRVKPCAGWKVRAGTC